MFLYYPKIELAIHNLVKKERLSEAIDTLAFSFGHVYVRSDFKKKQFFSPGFDALICMIGTKLSQSNTIFGEINGPDVFIFSEFYDGGGHSRVAESIVKTRDFPIIIVTDFFENYSRGSASISTIKERLPGVNTHLLQEKSLFSKTKELIRLLKDLKPRSISLFAHHPDPIPFLATETATDVVRKIFYHHADHLPALGATIHHYVHIDLTKNLADLCKHALNRNVVILPMGIDDFGQKRFQIPSDLAEYTVVFAGSEVKFMTEGNIKYQDLVLQFLSITKAKIVHIGVLRDEWLLAIRQGMIERGIMQDRFYYVPPVPSLWKTLLDLNAHLYAGSYPTLGGRGAIEAQGCGYPTLFYSGHKAPRGEPWEIFSITELGWSNVNELIDKCRLAMVNHSEYSKKSRQFFLETQGVDQFWSELTTVYDKLL